MGFFSTRSISTNTLLNFGSQGIVVLAAFISLPILVNYLSPSDFGLLSLVWSVIGYFSLFDFGISRAVTKYLSQAETTPTKEYALAVVWSSLILGLMIGCIGFILLYISSPLLSRILHEEIVQQNLSLIFFRISAVGIPFLVLFGILKGIFTAYFQFSVVNYYQLLMGVLQWAGAAVLSIYGFGLIEIIAFTVIGRIVITSMGIQKLPTTVSGFQFGQPVIRPHTIISLLKYGGWISVSQILAPIFLYLDRFFVASLISVAAVGWYTIPSEMVSRILIISVSLAGALFPLMSGISAKGSSQKSMYRLYVQSVRFLSLSVVPIIAVLFIFSKEILTVWVGPEIASESSDVLSILSIGMIFNSIAQIPTTVLHSQGNPKATGILHLIEIPIILGLNILLIPSYGIIGAAWAWSIRVMLDCMLLWWIVRNSFSSADRMPLYSHWLFLPGTGILCFLIVLIMMQDPTFLVKIISAGVVVSMLVLCLWMWLLETADRYSVVQKVGLRWMK